MTPLDPEQELHAAQIASDYAALERFHRYCWYCIAAAGAGVIVGLAYLQAKGGL